MKPCSKCGGTQFAIDATYTATDYVTIETDSDDLEIDDTRYGDGEWDDLSKVRCVVCDHTFEYQDWDNEPDYVGKEAKVS